MNNWPVLGALLCCLILIGCNNKKITEMIVPNVIKSSVFKDNNVETLRIFATPGKDGLALKGVGSWREHDAQSSLKLNEHPYPLVSSPLHRGDALEVIFSVPENLFISLEGQNASS
ncbi:hypothetical protein [Pantoea phytobeneficialis]|uniref:Uncharacterized protein n=1 Tax=Pantoea phytobeneficialis TaxID=2052056 RepID=A0AAP9H3K8_9GAMM|nr:hypothetical protein [Pantoea phytobeneficialis]MDO6408101.1 hypothetical protein [Pantoea phytobeneficialis]QGR05867.1 hypothetical protein CTZ24_05360 [Pantoea phytobeneficialis]